MEIASFQGYGRQSCFGDFQAILPAEIAMGGSIAEAWLGTLRIHPAEGIPLFHDPARALLDFLLDRSSGSTFGRNEFQ
jgi:hypothetical protein